MDQSQAFNHSLFPWVRAVQKKFLQSFPGDYNLEALQFFQKNVEEELQKVRNRRRRSVLFETLVEFYSHFCWKIKWDEPSPHMKDACVLLLSSLTKVGVMLCSGDLHSNFCSRIMAALRMFPGEDNLLLTALLLVTHLKKKFHEVYRIILKQFLFSSHLVIDKPEAFLKVVLLSRRLKSMAKDRSERNSVLLSASALKPPPDTLHWLSLRCPGALCVTKVKLLVTKLMSDKLPADTCRRLREVLLPGLSVKTSTSKKAEKLEQLGSFVIDTVPGGQNDSEIQFTDSDSPQNLSVHELPRGDSPKLHLKRKRAEKTRDNAEERLVIKTTSVKKVKKPPKICANHSDSDLKLQNRGVLTENSSQMEFAATISSKSPISVASETKQNADKKLKKGKKRLRLSNSVGDKVVVEGSSLSSESEHKLEQFEAGIVSNMESPMVIIKTTSVKKVKNPPKICANHSDSDLKLQNRGVLTENSSQMEFSIDSSAIVKKSKRLLSGEGQLDSVEQNVSLVFPADSSLKSKELNTGTFSNEESSLIHAPIRKSRRLLVAESMMDHSVHQGDSSICPGTRKQESKRLDTDFLSNEESSLIHAPIRKSKRLFTTESKLDPVTHSIDQDNSSVCRDDCEEESKELDTPNEEFSLIHATIGKSKRILDTETKLKPVTDSVNQDSSVCHDDSKEESKELDTDTLNDDSSLLHAPIRKSRRLLTSEDKLGPVTDSVDQDSSICHADRKKESKDLDTNTSNEDSSLIHATVRKSRRLLATEGKVDLVTDSIDQDNSICHADSKEESKELDTHTSKEESSLIHAPIRKSRLLTTESKLDPATYSIDQDNSSVCHDDSKEESKELDTDTSNEESSLIHATIRKSKRILATETKLKPVSDSVDQDSSICQADSKKESKELDTDTLNDESSLIHAPIRKSRRLLTTESKLGPVTDSVDQDSSICHTDSKEESKELDSHTSNEESSLIHAPIMKSKRLLTTESKLDPVTHSIDQDNSSVCRDDCEEESKELDTPNEEFSLIHATIGKSKRILDTETKLKPVTDSVNQDSSVCHDDSKEESKELDTDTLNDDSSLLHAPIRKSRRLLTSEDKLGPVTDSVDQDSSICHADRKKESKDLDTNTSNEDSSLIHATVRKSRRLLATEGKVDLVTDSIDQDNSICHADSKEESKELDTHTSKEESSLIHAPIRKSRLLTTESKLDPATYSIDQDNSSVCHDDSKEESKELDTDTSNEESSLIHATIRKSKRILATETKLKPVSDSVDQDSSICQADSKKESKELDTDTLNDESSLIHAPIRKSRRLLTTESKLGPVTDSVDQDSSICHTDSKEESKELDSHTSNEESSLIHAPIMKSKRLLTTESKLDPVTHSIDQDNSSVCRDDCEEESKELDTPNEEFSLIHATIGKSKRILDTETKLKPVTDSVDQDSSICHTDSKEESKELDTNTSNEDSSLIHATVRKSRRLLATEGKVDLVTDSVDQDNSICHADSKELDIDTSNEESSLIHAPIRKSRLLTTESKLDPATYSIDQDNSSVCHDDSKEESKELDTDTSNEESSLSHATIRKSKRILATETKLKPVTDSIDQDSSICHADSKKESKELDTDTSNEESSLIHTTIRKSRRLLTTEGKVDQVTDSVDQDSSISHVDSKKESKELDTDTSNEESSLIHTTIRKSRRLLTTERKVDPMTDSINQDSSICHADSKKERKELVTDMWPNKESVLLHSPIRKSKRILAIETKLNPVTDFIDQDSSICHDDSKEESEELDTNTSNEESSLIKSPIRKSERLLASESMQDNSVDQGSSIYPGESKQETKELGTDTLSNDKSLLLHSSIRKSKRILAIETKLNPVTDFIDQDSSICHDDSKEESEELDTNTSNEESSLLHAPIRKSESTTSTQDHSVDQGTSPICAGRENKELDVDSLSNEESSSIDVPIRKSKRLLTSESMTDAIDQGVNSIWLADSKQENKILDTDTLSKKELSLVHVQEPIRKRLLTAESKLDPEANSVDQDKFPNSSVDEQVGYVMNSDTLSNREYSLIHSHLPIRKSKRLIAVENKICSETDSTCHGSVRDLNDHKVNVGNDSLENETVSNCKPISNVLSDILQVSSDEDLEESNCKVLETDIGFKIICSSEEFAPLRKSSRKIFSGTKSNIASSDFIGECFSSGKTSPEGTTDCQNIPVVIISPAENVGICSECEPPAVDNHLLHPLNCEGIPRSHSIPLNEKRPALDPEGKATSQLNVSKVGSHDSELPNLCKNSSPKNEDDLISSTRRKHLSSLKNPDHAVGTSSLNENLRVDSLTESEMRVEIPLITNDTLDSNVKEEAYDLLKERAVKYVLDKMLTTVENADTSKFSPKKTAICSKGTSNTIGAVSGMTFSPFIRKSKNYLSFSDVSQEKESGLSLDDTPCKLEDRIKDESTEFLGYRDFEDDLCDNKSESVMSEFIKIEHASSCASSFDSNDEEDFADDASTPPANTKAAEMEGRERQDSAGGGTERLSAVCVESGAGVKDAAALENEESSNSVSVSSNAALAKDPKCLEISLTSPIAVVSIGKRCNDGSSDREACSSEIADPDASGTDEVIDEDSCPTDGKTARKCSKGAEKDGSVQQTLHTEMENRSKDAKVQSAEAVTAPSTRLQSKRVLMPLCEESDSNPAMDSSASYPDIKGKRAAANSKKAVSARRAPSRNGTSSAYSLRCSTRSKARDNVLLGLDFTKLSLESPTHKRKKVTFKGELDCVAKDEEKTVEENNTDASRRSTRSSASVETGDCLKPKEQASNSESYNLRRSKRTLVLPGKLKL